MPRWRCGGSRKEKVQGYGGMRLPSFLVFRSLYICFPVLSFSLKQQTSFTTDLRE